MMVDMADDARQNELIAQFTGVTGVEAERAKFYLESAAWELDVSSISWRIAWHYCK